MKVIFEKVLSGGGVGVVKQVRFAQQLNCLRMRKRHVWLYAFRLADRRSGPAKLPDLLRHDHKPQGRLRVLFLYPADDWSRKQFDSVKDTLMCVGEINF